MDCLVSQLTSRSSQIANRRKVWPARRHLDNLEIADIAAPDLFTERRMVGVKAPVEAQHDGNVCGPDDAHGIDRFLIIQADWLLAVDCFARPGRSLHVIDMGIRRGANKHGLHVFAVKDLVSVASRLSSSSPPQVYPPIRR